MPQLDDCIDDPAISSTEVLWRYVHPTQVTAGSVVGEWRPKSGVFRDTSHRMSVDVASQTTLEAAKTRNPGKFIAQFTVKLVRDVKKNVTQKIDLDPDNPSHAVVCPALSGSEARVLANQYNVWALPPPGDFVSPL